MAILRPKGKRKSWVVVVYTGRDPQTGKETRSWRSFDNRQEAEQYEAQMKGHVRSGGTIASGKLLVRDYLDQWLRDYGELKNLAPSTRRNYKDMVRNHMAPSPDKIHSGIPALGNLQLRRLSPAKIAQFLSAELREGHLSPTAVQYHFGVLHKALTVAVRQGLLMRNPCDMVDRPGRARFEMKVLDEEQTRLFLAEAKRYAQARGSSTYYVLFLAAVLTGMRQGELLGLRWKDVDLTLGRLSVTQTLYRLGRQKIFKEPKSTRSRRSVALPAVLVEELRQLREEQSSRRRDLGAAYEDSDLVFCQHKGRPLHGHNVTRRDLRRILDRAKLFRLEEVRDRKTGEPVVDPETDKVKTRKVFIRFHDLRHSHATHMLRQGVSPKVVQERLGHATPGFTLAVYSHVLPGMQEEAAEKVAEWLMGVPTSSNGLTSPEGSQAFSDVPAVTGDDEESRTGRGS